MMRMLKSSVMAVLSRLRLKPGWSNALMPRLVGVSGILCAGPG
jgi:hypothetical protein